MHVLTLTRRILHATLHPGPAKDRHEMSKNHVVEEETHLQIREAGRKLPGRRPDLAWLVLQLRRQGDLWEAGPVHALTSQRGRGDQCRVVCFHFVRVCSLSLQPPELQPTLPALRPSSPSLYISFLSAGVPWGPGDAPTSVPHIHHLMLPRVVKRLLLKEF